MAKRKLSEATKAAHKEYMRRYRETHREEYNQYYRDYYAKHKREVYANTRKWLDKQAKKGETQNGR